MKLALALALVALSGCAVGPATACRCKPAASVWPAPYDPAWVATGAPMPWSEVVALWDEEHGLPSPK